MTQLLLRVALIFCTSGLVHGAPASGAGSLIKPNALTDLQSETTKAVELPTPNDDLRTLRILNSLIKRAGWFHEIKVEVNEGIVTIQGEAETIEQLNWLAKTADRLPSVIAIINKASIKELGVTDLSPARAEFLSLLTRAKKLLPLLLLTLLFVGTFFFVSAYISRGLHALWGRHIQNPFLLQTVSRITMLPIWAFFIYIVLQMIGLSNIAGALIGGTGLAGIAIGFAFKDIAQNYISGILLAMKSPFTEGDLIKVGQHSGTVQDLTMRGTQIVDANGTVILIPNSIIIQSVIENSNTTPYSRSSFMVGIAQSDSIRAAQDLILKTLPLVKDIVDKPSPNIVVDKLGDTTVDLEVSFWFDAKLNSRVVRSEAIATVKSALTDAGFTLPFPTREIIFDSEIKLARNLAEKDQASAGQVRP